MGCTMKLYEEGTIIEWSRVLTNRFGNYFRLYSSEEETLERWSERLSFLYGFRFKIEPDIYETLLNWSKLIGG